MTTTTLLNETMTSASIRTLGWIEARRYLRRISIWVGLGVTVLFLLLPSQGWSGDSYATKGVGAFSPLILGVFIAAVRTGNRDRRGDASPLAEEAPLDASNRAVARLLGLAAPVGVCVITVIGVLIASRIEGGYWIGENPRRTDSAQHSFLELLQPPLLVALAGAIGVAAGRALRHVLIAIVAGGVFWMFAFVGSWAWNTQPLHTIAVIQTQPITIDLGPGIVAEQLPTNWLANAPDEHDANWRRELVHLPTVAGHNLYLLGLLGVASGLAVRGLWGRRLAFGGLAAAVAGVAIQLAIMP